LPTDPPDASLAPGALRPLRLRAATGGVVVRRVVAFATLLAALALVIPLQPVAAFSINGCTVTVTSTDGSGKPLDTATGGGTGGTQDHPFKVDLKGSVHYEGALSAQAGAYTSSVTVYGLPFLSSSGDNNEAPQAAGDVDVSAFPIPVVGVFPVSGSLKGATASCSGDGWIQIVGDPLTAPQLWVGVILVAGAAVLLFVWVRPSPALGAVR